MEAGRGSASPSGVLARQMNAEAPSGAKEETWFIVKRCVRRLPPSNERALLTVRQSASTGALRVDILARHFRNDRQMLMLRREKLVSLPRDMFPTFPRYRAWHTSRRCGQAKWTRCHC